MNMLQANNPSFPSLTSLNLLSAFTDVDPEVVDRAALLWFQTWSSQSTTDDDTIERSMPYFHVLSNRLDCTFERTFAEMESIINSKSWPGNTLHAVSLFQACLTGQGWMGMAMRCWTDMKGAAGFISFVGSNGHSYWAGDLNIKPFFIQQYFINVVETYPQVLAADWVMAAYIRLAMDEYVMKNVSINMVAIRDLGSSSSTDSTLISYIGQNPQHRVLAETLVARTGLWLHMGVQEGGRLNINPLGRWMHHYIRLKQTLTHLNSTTTLKSEDIVNSIRNHPDTALTYMFEEQLGQFPQIELMDFHDAVHWLLSDADVTVPLPENLVL